MGGGGAFGKIWQKFWGGGGGGGVWKNDWTILL